MTQQPPPDRCRHHWHAGGMTHTCWEPPGHTGVHRCRIGDCDRQPATLAVEPERAP